MLMLFKYSKGTGYMKISPRTKILCTGLFDKKNRESVLEITFGASVFLFCGFSDV